MNSNFKSLLVHMWGTTLERVDFDLQQISVTLAMRGVSHEDPDTIHPLDFLNVSDLHFFNSIPTPWNYAEVTELYQDTSCTDGYRIEIILWDEAAEMIITAESVLFDGEPLLPDGPGQLVLFLNSTSYEGKNTAARATS